MMAAQAAQAPPVGHVPPARPAPPGPPVARAAVAEALHVGGRFAEAARAWAALAGAGHETPLSALKAAMSYLAAGEERLGLAWLDRASAAGAGEADVLYVTAQHALSRGRADEAEAALRRARRLDAAGPAATALGVLRWRAGARRQARRLFEEALARRPPDPLAGVDLVSADLQQRRRPDRRAAVAMLSRAAAAAPHRPEPFVLYSRLGLPEAERRQALARARLRTRQLLEHRPEAPGPPPAGEAAVRLSREPGAGPAGARGLRAGLRVTARFDCDAHPPGGLPATVRVNRGYHTVTVAGRPALPVAEPVADQAAGAGDAGPATVRYALPASAWTLAGGRATLEVEAAGTPVAPFARVEERWLELGEGSAWVPVPGPGWRWRFAPVADLGAGATTVWSRPGPSAEGLAVVALDGAERVTTAAPGAVQEAAGRAGRPLLRRAAELALRAGARWEDLLGLPTPAATVVVLDRPGSTFCYHRPGLTRLTAEVAADPGQEALVYHEVGHHWWGGAVRVAPGDRWLAEALAEYTLHLVEEAGDLPGYLPATLAALRRLGGGRLPAGGLAALATTPGVEAAFTLRAKGGHVLRMLRAVVGDAAFRATLRACAEQDGELDGYTFFALAGHFHGHTLDWFANQWVHADAAARLAVDGVRVRRRRGGWEVAFTARCDGHAVPGAPVEFLVRGTEGSVVVRAEVDLAPARVAARVPGRPRSITVDPALRWYADVPERVVSLQP